MTDSIKYKCTVYIHTLAGETTHVTTHETAQQAYQEVLKWLKRHILYVLAGIHDEDADGVIAHLIECVAVANYHSLLVTEHCVNWTYRDWCNKQGFTTYKDYIRWDVTPLEGLKG